MIPNKTAHQSMDSMAAGAGACAIKERFFFDISL